MCDDFPLVSVLVPIYNVEGYLGQCLASLESQTLRDIEIICIDDGSTDSCPDIIARHAAADARIRVITKPNSGYGDSMNRGIDAARGAYVGICEPDDFADARMFEVLYDATRSYDDPDIVKCAYRRIIRAGAPDQAVESCYYLGKLHPPCQPFELKQCPDIIFYHPSIWTCLYRRSFLDGNNIRFEPIPGAGWADNPFLMETMVAAKSIVYIDELLYNYREFEDGTMSHVKDWHILVDRWCEMDDILRNAGMDDAGVLERHYNRGCAYLEMLDADFDASNPEIKQASRAMAARMDYAVIYASDLIAQPLKDAYQRRVPVSMRFRQRLSRTR